MGMCFPLAEFSGELGPSGFGAKTAAARVLEEEDLRGKVYLLTGGTSGIGLEVTRALFNRGAHVVLAARNIQVCKIVGCKPLSNIDSGVSAASNSWARR